MEQTGEYKLVLATLRALSMEGTYSENFCKDAMTDEIVAECIAVDQNLLANLIPPLGHRLKFMKEFSKQVRNVTPELDVEFQSIARNQDEVQKHRQTVAPLLQHRKLKYSGTMPVIAQTSLDRADFDSRENTLREELIQELSHVIREATSSEACVADGAETLTDHMIAERPTHLQAFQNRCKQDELAVDVASFEAKKYYHEQMEKKLESKPWFEPEELREIHNEVLKVSLETCKEKIKLTDHQVRMLEEAFQLVYAKYVEDNERRSPSKIPAIGIDLGTTYSCAAVYVNGSVKLIPNLQSDDKTTPSYVAFNSDGSIDVGALAQEKSFRNPQNTIFDAKRLIGRKYSDAIVQQDIQLWPFHVVDANDEPRIRIHNKDYRPEEISAKVLAKIKEIAESYLGRKVTKAVVTVPAYFRDSQRKATKDAAEIAGLEATILNEPTAAAIAYQLHRTIQLKRNVLIFDLGGGTFDVAVLVMDKGRIEVKAIGGDTHLGGEDFDHAMVEAIVERVKTRHGIDLTRGKYSEIADERLKASGRIRRLRSYCEAQKRNLSQVPAVTIAIEKLDNDFDLYEEFTREEFNRINLPRFEKCISEVAKTIEDAGIKVSEIDDIVLVGGSTRIPKVREMLKNFFGGKKEFSMSVPADEAVALGAAYQAALLNGEETSTSIINHKFHFRDVTPHSIGVSTFPNRMKVIIPKNTPVPCRRKSYDYKTRYDNQVAFEVRIYEGENSLVTENFLLGRFRITGVPPAPAGREEMDLTMIIDTEGVLHVEAELTRGERAGISIETFNGRMTKEEKEAAKNQLMFHWTSEEA